MKSKQEFGLTQQAIIVTKTEKEQLVKSNLILSLSRQR
jgi:hypothetical protein